MILKSQDFSVCSCRPWRHQGLTADALSIATGMQLTMHGGYWPVLIHLWWNRRWIAISVLQVPGQHNRNAIFPLKFIEALDGGKIHSVEGVVSPLSGDSLGPNSGWLSFGENHHWTCSGRRSTHQCRLSSPDWMAWVIKLPFLVHEDVTW